MNKKGYVDWETLIILIFVIPILLLIFATIINSFNSMNQKCPECTCDYSQYQYNLTNCTNLVENLTKQINETPIQYVQNITYVDKPVEKIVYKESIPSIIILSLTFVLSIFLTLRLFSIKIKLPEEVEEKIKKFEKTIIFIKVLSLIVSFLILVKLIFILFSFSK